MIAVFAHNEHQVRELDISPKDGYKWIRKESDLRAIKFIGVIYLRDWWSNEMHIRAREALKHRQPDLFKSSGNTD